MTTDSSRVRDTFLPFSRPSIGDAEIAELLDTLHSGWITTGPRVERFTAEFARYVGGSHATALASATAGLHVALLAHNIGPGDEVITTPLTLKEGQKLVLGKLRFADDDMFVVLSSKSK